KSNIFLLDDLKNIYNFILQWKLRFIIFECFFTNPFHFNSFKSYGSKQNLKYESMKKLIFIDHNMVHLTLLFSLEFEKEIKEVFCHNKSYFFNCKVIDFPHYFFNIMCLSVIKMTFVFLLWRRQQRKHDPEQNATKKGERNTFFERKCRFITKKSKIYHFFFLLSLSKLFPMRYLNHGTKQQQQK
ncbi:hypothetical protein RFI_10928, partial [Reticulomyxa filosa]